MAMAIARVAAPGRMRVLSAACSTGEEAYSAAIALLAGGLPATHVEVVGLDVSSAVLAVAASGSLPRTALRGTIPAWSEPYLERRADGTVAIAPLARARVTFALANLLMAPASGPYDAILCRNLLIYLTPPARTRVTDWLRSQLAPDAPLFVGHAEVGVLLEAGWVRSPAHGPYALRPAAAAAPLGDAAPARVLTSASVARPALGSTRAAPAMPAPSQPSAVRLAAAVALAEAGAREEAVEALGELLRDEPGDVEAHALLGVLHATAGRPDAARVALRRALYLDPEHAESRAQLAILDAATPAPGTRL
jgi:chemotaxis protein methyltransferase WspC